MNVGVVCDYKTQLEALLQRLLGAMNIAVLSTSMYERLSKLCKLG